MRDFIITVIICTLLVLAATIILVPADAQGPLCLTRTPTEITPDEIEVLLGVRSALRQDY